MRVYVLTRSWPLHSDSYDTDFYGVFSTPEKAIEYTQMRELKLQYEWIFDDDAGRAKFPVWFTHTTDDHFWYIQAADIDRMLAVEDR